MEFNHSYFYEEFFIIMQNCLDADTGLHYFQKYSIRLKGHSVRGGLQKSDQQ